VFRESLIYLRVLASFVRNGLVREMSFRGNFLVTVVTGAFWFTAQLVLFQLIYAQTDQINGWNRYEFFAFMATSMMVNTLVQSVFMPNCANFSELIRAGNLDFVLLKPIDAQFLVSFERIDLGNLCQLALSGMLLWHAVAHLDALPGWEQTLLYAAHVAMAVAFFYSLMISLAATSVWFGRNQGLYDFWFYITIFARYPQDVYRGAPWVQVLSFVFSYILPILIVVTVPARLLTGKLLGPSWIGLACLSTTLLSLVVSRWIFLWSLRCYRSASS